MAGIKLYLATPKIWDYFVANEARLKNNEDCIAENQDIKKALYLTAGVSTPMLVLYSEDKPIIWRPVRTKKECGEAAVRMITTHLAGVEQNDETDCEYSVVDSKDTVTHDSTLDEGSEPDEEEENQKILDAIYEREDGLEQAVGDCLAKILIEEDVIAVKEGYPGLISSVVDMLLQYLYDEQGISVYRPTLLEDEETGEEVFAEFPYGWDDGDEM